MEIASYTAAVVAANLKANIENTIIGYHKLAVKYDSLPLAARRSVVNKHSVERFYCAALFQFQTDVASMNAENCKTLGKTPITKREIPANEQCPVARGWFNTLFEAQERLNGFIKSGYPDGELEPISALSNTAFQAYMQAEEWLAMVVGAAEEKDSNSLLAVIEGWNILCTDVKETHIAAPTAAQNASFYMSTRPKLQFEKPTKASGAQREWFEYELAFSA